MKSDIKGLREKLQDVTYTTVKMKEEMEILNNLTLASKEHSSQIEMLESNMNKEFSIINSNIDASN